MFSPESFRLVCSSGCVWSANSKAHLCSDCGVLSDIPCVPWAWGFHFIHHFQRIPSIRSTAEISVAHTRVRSHLCVHTYMCMCPHESNQAWQRDTLQLWLNSCGKLYYPVPFGAPPALSYLLISLPGFFLVFWTSESGFKRVALKTTGKKTTSRVTVSFSSTPSPEKNTPNSCSGTESMHRRTHLWSSILQVNRDRRVSCKWKISNGPQSSFDLWGIKY